MKIQNLKRLKPEFEINYPLTTTGVRVQSGSALHRQIWEQIYRETESHKPGSAIGKQDLYNRMAGMFRAHPYPISYPDELFELLDKFYRKALYRQVRFLAKKVDAANGSASGLIGFSASNQVAVTNPGKGGQEYIDFFRLRHGDNPEVQELLDQVQQFFDATHRIPTHTELEVYTENIEMEQTV